MNYSSFKPGDLVEVVGDCIGSGCILLILRFVMFHRDGAETYDVYCVQDSNKNIVGRKGKIMEKQTFMNIGRNVVKM